MKRTGWICLVFPLAFVIGCDGNAGQQSDKGKDTQAQKTKVERRKVEIGKEITTDSGLKYIDEKEGTGREAEEGKYIRVHYTGWLKDGTKFDSSRDPGKKPLTCLLGHGPRGVIQGWIEGVAGMKEGGKRKLIIPYQLAYGEQGMPPAIPPKAELTFEIELLKVG